MVVESDSCCIYGRARVVRKEHHTSRFWKACWEKVFEPELVALRPGFSRMIGTAFKVEPVDCHNAGRIVCQQDIKAIGRRTYSISAILLGCPSRTLSKISCRPKPNVVRDTAIGSEAEASTDCWIVGVVGGVALLERTTFARVR